MPRTLLLLLLALAVVLEAGLTGGAFFAPAFTLQKFGATYGPSTAFLTYIVAWLLLGITLVAGLALAWVWRRRRGYAGLCYVLGLWWLGVGVGIYATFGRPDNLLLDSLKGLLLVVLTAWCQARRAVVQR
ncbi:protein BatD [Hymenobacter sp. RP-2-7]|uniref:Protein BatD n=1 Tax=Hymenobacter polaris TaxID=2682546 RepID=A0A7Y0AC86_9BACT|nr:hypothetical protein [Hymenobacter polaris]NML64699.1 protein BatD [Hymenobacter polaris]